MDRFITTSRSSAGGPDGGTGTISGNNRIIALKGYDDERYCVPAHGGAGGGVMKIHSSRGDVYFGRVRMSFDGANVYAPGVAGGGGGGTMQIWMPGSAKVIFSKEARLTFRGGYTRATPPNVWTGATGEDALGGGGVLEILRISWSTGGKLEVRLLPSNIDVSSGAYLCPSATDPSITGPQHCDCTAEVCGYEDGRIDIIRENGAGNLAGSSVGDVRLTAAEVPDTIADVLNGVQDTCIQPRMTILTGGNVPSSYSPSTGCCYDPAGGQEMRVRVSTLRGETWTHDLTKDVEVFVAGIAIPSSDISTTGVQGSSAAATRFDVVIELPAIHGTNLNVSVRTTYGG